MDAGTSQLAPTHCSANAVVDYASRRDPIATIENWDSDSRAWFADGSQQLAELRKKKKKNIFFVWFFITERCTRHIPTLVTLWHNFPCLSFLCVCISNASTFFVFLFPRRSISTAGHVVTTIFAWVVLELRFAPFCCCKRKAFTAIWDCFTCLEIRSAGFFWFREKTASDGYDLDFSSSIFVHSRFLWFGYWCAWT